jgi:hypothetical protein
MMQRHVSGQRGAGLRQQDFSTAVPTGAVCPSSINGSCVRPADIRLKRAAGEKADRQAGNDEGQRNACHGEFTPLKEIEQMGRLPSLLHVRPG